MPLGVLDPFDLPEWLAAGPVVWQATEETVARSTVHGLLRPLQTAPDAQHHRLALDLLAVDVAWPSPVCDDRQRQSAHQAWHYGEVLLLEVVERATLAVPCIEFGSDLVCEAVRRFSRAVGADPARYLVQLRL